MKAFLKGATVVTVWVASTASHGAAHSALERPHRLDGLLEIADGPDQRPNCRGVRTTANTILTAKHCASGRTIFARPMGALVWNEVNVVWSSLQRDIVVAVDSLGSAPVRVPLARSVGDAALESSRLYLRLADGHEASVELLSYDQERILARPKDAALCFGDSGTPLLIRGKSPRVVGVLSNGDEKCEQNGLATFTRVDSLELATKASTQAKDMKRSRSK